MQATKAGRWEHVEPCGTNATEDAQHNKHPWLGGKDAGKPTKFTRQQFHSHQSRVTPRSKSAWRYVECCSVAYTDPQTGIKILGVVCCYYAAVFPPTHDGMCRLRLLWHVETIGWVPLPDEYANIMPLGWFDNKYCCKCIHFLSLLTMLT